MNWLLEALPWFAVGAVFAACFDITIERRPWLRRVTTFHRSDRSPDA